jgi:hypothetical protein
MHRLYVKAEGFKPFNPLLTRSNDPILVHILTSKSDNNDYHPLQLDAMQGNSNVSGSRAPLIPT